MLKRVLSMLLVCVMLVGMLPIQVLAEEADAPQVTETTLSAETTEPEETEATTVPTETEEPTVPETTEEETESEDYGIMLTSEDDTEDSVTGTSLDTSNLTFDVEDPDGYVTVSFTDNGIRPEGANISDAELYGTAVGTIIPATRVPYVEGDSIATVTVRLLDAMELEYDSTGTVKDGFYLSALEDFELNGTYYARFGEFDAGNQSGWCVRLNNWHINQGTSAIEVEDEDVISWLYTCQFGADIGADYSSKSAEITNVVLTDSSLSLEEGEDGTYTCEVPVGTSYIAFEVELENYASVVTVTVDGNAVKYRPNKSISVRPNSTIVISTELEYMDASNNNEVSTYTDSMTIQLTEKPANRAPVVSENAPSSLSATAGEETTVVLSGLFTDPDGDTLTYHVKCEALGIDTDVSGSVFAGTIPTAGAYEFVVTASDGEYSASHTVTVAVTEASNNAPTVMEGAITEMTAYVEEEISVDLSKFFTDADGDTLTYNVKIADLSVNETLEGSTFTGTIPTAGTYSVQLTANDGTASVSHTVTLTVTEKVNTAPNIKAAYAETKSNTYIYSSSYVYIYMDEIFEDADGDTLTYKATLDGEEVDITYNSWSKQYYIQFATKPAVREYKIWANDGLADSEVFTAKCIGTSAAITAKEGEPLIPGGNYYYYIMGTAENDTFAMEYTLDVDETVDTEWVSSNANALVSNGDGTFTVPESVTTRQSGYVGVTAGKDAWGSAIYLGTKNFYILPGKPEVADITAALAEHADNQTATVVSSAFTGWYSSEFDYEVEDPSICDLTTYGTYGLSITPKALGTTKVTATFKYDESIQCSFTVTVTGRSLQIKDQPDSDDVIFADGKTVQLEVLGAEEGETFTWTSSDETVATVDGNGLVTLKSLGQTYITATSSLSTEDAEVKASMYLQVKETGKVYLDEVAITDYTYFDGFISAKSAFNSAQLTYNWSLGETRYTYNKLAFTPYFDDENLDAVLHYQVSGGEYQTMDLTSGTAVSITNGLNPGNNVVKIDVYPTDDEDNVTTYTFNIFRPYNPTMTINSMTVYPNGETALAYPTYGRGTNTLKTNPKEATIYQCASAVSETTGLHEWTVSAYGYASSWSASAYTYKTYIFGDRTKTISLYPTFGYTNEHVGIFVDGTYVEEAVTAWKSTALDVSGLTEGKEMVIELRVLSEKAYALLDKEGLTEAEIFADPEVTYTIYVENVTPLGIEAQILSAELSIGEFYAPGFKSNVYSTSALIPSGETTADLTFTVPAGIDVYKTSVSDANKLTAKETDEDGNQVFTTSTVTITGTGSSAYSTTNIILQVTDEDGNVGKTQYAFTVNQRGTKDVYPDSVVEYLCLGSQYTNGSAYGTMPERTLKSNGGVLSLGNFGGYIVYKYDTPIENNPNNPYGVDFVVYGNSFGNGAHEPGYVQVSQDGKTWYTLAGSDHYEDHNDWNYSMTYTNVDGKSSWTNSDGESGTNYNYPVASAYPYFTWTEALEQSMTVSGPRLNSSAKDAYGSAAAVLPVFGYVDVNTNGTINGTSNNPYNHPGTLVAGGDQFDLDWAVDDKGLPVSLDSISYIRIATASSIYAGAIGEKSTEVTAVNRVTNTAAEAVGVTSAPTAIKINGTDITVPANGGVLSVSVPADEAFTVAVTTAGDANVYIGNTGDAERTYTAIPETGIVRIIVQEGEKEPYICYLVIEEYVVEDHGVTIIAPAGSKISVGGFRNYFIYDFSEILQEKTLDDGRVAVTFAVPDNGQSFYRVQHDQGVTYWNYESMSAGSSFEVTEEDLYIGSTDFNKETVYANFEKNTYDRADLYMNINEKGYMAMSVGQTFELNMFRNWIALGNTITNDKVALPDMEYRVIAPDGSASDVVTVAPDEHNSCVATLTANKAGTAIVLVSYDAMTNADGAGGTQFSAIWPENTGVFVVTVGSDGSSIVTNMTINEEANSGGKQVIDAEHDILFYTGDEGAQYSFKPESGCVVSVNRAVVGSTLTFSGFTTSGVTTAEDGTITVTGLPTGNNIVKVEKDGVATYQVIRARKVTYDLLDADGNVLTEDYAIKHGETVQIQFHGLVMPIEKLSGVYNANAGFAYVGEDGTAFTKAGGTYGVYNFSSSESLQRFSITIPQYWNSDSYTIQDGAIKIGGYGSNAGDHRATTYAAGKGVNTNAIGMAGVLSSLPDITIRTQPSGIITYRATLPTGEGYTVTGDDGPIMEGESYSFTVTICGGYDGNDMVVKNNGTQITGTDGVYTIENVRENLLITVEGVTKIETVVPEETTVIYTNGTDGSNWPHKNVYIDTIAIGGAEVKDYSWEGDNCTVTLDEDTPANAAITFVITMWAKKESYLTRVSSTLNGTAISADDPCAVALVNGKATAEVYSKFNDYNLGTKTFILTVAEKEITPDQAAANDVIAMIDAIGEVTLESEEAIADARKAYESLTEEQKALVTNLDALTAAETALEGKKAVAAVMEQINAIGTVTLNSEEAIITARNAYDALTDAQKELVSNYDVLVEAEEILELLKRPLADIQNIYATTGDYLSALSTPTVGATNGEWRVIGLARSGRDVADGYYDNVVSYVQSKINANEQLNAYKSTDNSRLILALTAIGKDVTDVGGHNLLKGLTSMSYVTYQGVNGPIWALLAFDSHAYTIPTGDVTREKLVNEILNAQLSDGGWALSGTSSDADMTGMALQALAPYYNTNAAVKTAVDKALSWLSNVQRADGSFAGTDGVSAESLVQVITALTALGINPEEDTRFIKNGLSAIDALAEFYVEGGGFQHILSGSLDMMATEQSYYALASYFRLLKGKTSLYDMTDVTIYTAALDKEAAEAVEALIEAIGTVTDESEAAITAARNAYDALTDTQKALISNLSILEDAEKALAELKKTAEDEAAASAVEKLITDIGNVTLDREDEIKAAREAYDKLSDLQKTLVDNAAVLTSAENKLAALKVDALIDAIGSNITASSKTAIQNARNAYNALSEEQKALVTKYQTLVNAEAKLKELNSTISVSFTLLGCYKHGSGETSVHTLAGGNLSTWISTTTIKVTVGATVKDVFEKALTAAGMSWSNPTGNYVESINGIGEFTNGKNSGWMYTLNGTHPNLGVAQQTVVNGDVIVFHYTDDYTLENASQGYKNYSDEEAANAVEKLIKDIGDEITLDSEAKIVAAREAYEKLTEAQKKLVENYDDLVAAEKALAELKNAVGEDIYKTTGDYLESLGTPNVGAVGGEWLVIGLARSGRDVPAAYYDNVVTYVNANINASEQLHSNKSTDNSRVILALTAIGKDVTDVDGHNLLAGLTDMDYVCKQGINGPIWALIAFDSGNYPIPEGNVTRETLIETILAAQLSDGGWALSGSTADPDMTGMAVQALAPYCNTNAKVKKAVENAVWAMSKMQSDNGSYSSVDGASSESIAQIITALSALGIDADTDARFIKNGISAWDALLTYYVEGGGFCHILSGKLDGMATEQAYYAMTAYYRMLNNETALYDMTDVIDMGGDAEVAETTQPTEPEAEQGSIGDDSGFPWWILILIISAGAITVLVIKRKKLFQ